MTLREAIQVLATRYAGASAADWYHGDAIARDLHAILNRHPETLCCLSLYRAAGGQTSGGDCPRCGAGRGTR